MSLSLNPDIMTCLLFQDVPLYIIGILHNNEIQILNYRSSSFFFLTIIVVWLNLDVKASVNLVSDLLN